MKTVTRSTFRIALLLFALGIATKLAQEPVLADSCHDECQIQYNGCLSNAASQYNSCAENADSALSNCQTDADWAFDDRVEYYCGGYTWTACVEAQEAIRVHDYAKCQDTYAGALNTCQNNESSADAVCSSNLQNCEDSCP